MVVSHFAKYSKTVAWIFASIFYAQFVFGAGAMVAQSTYNLENSHGVGTSFATAMPGRVQKTAAPLAQKEKATANTEKSPGNKFTTGPTQPEMQSYQSVNTNNMVDLFTGDFSYNIPLLDVGGYPVSLHYQSGITMDQEASWVGLGWNINPGNISRNMRGLPDDFNGTDKVTKELSMKENRTLGLTIGANAELLGVSKFTAVKGTPDSVLGRPGTLGLSLGVFHNTYKGWGTEFGLNAGINSGTTAQGQLSGGLSITNNSQDGLDVSPSFSFNLSKNEKKTVGSALTIGTNFNSRAGIQTLQLTGQVRVQNNDAKKMRYSIGTSATASYSFSQPSFTPTISVPFTSQQFSFTAKVGFEQWAFHPNFYARGYSATQYIAKDDHVKEMPAFGYLYYQQAKGSPDVLLDFNREKDVAYRNNTPHIALPIYTYDTYSITGEGTGGMFRPYRGDIGYVYDHALTTKSGSNRISLDYGVGTIFHGGIDLNTVYASTNNYPWLSDNALKDVVAFKEKDSVFEEVYFKNPGEKTLVDKSFHDAIGGDKLVRADLSPLQARNSDGISIARSLTMFDNAKPAGKVPVPRTVLRTKRDKRTQVISYLTAHEAGIVGLDKFIRSYPVNVFPSTNCAGIYNKIPRDLDYRKKHHLSELTVLNPDGRRYVYGLPVYNIESEDVTFSTTTGDASTGLVSYTPGVDDSVINNRPKEGYFNKETMPAYAHSFLLSGILSNDYVDLTGDGISEDDLGDAVKFNYTQVYAAGNGYNWRAPYQQSKAAYNEGLKTESRDEKGSYSWGSREVWYLNSVESKTMIATFTLETSVVRKDGHAVLGKNGGIDNTKKLYRLKEINLYSKADFLKNGNMGRPVKTVHFEYSYELCSNNPSSIESAGKLTLKKVWFTYNKNNKGQQNPFEFTYHQNNPAYNNTQVDRWGNYKKSSDNPGAAGQELSNADYAYTLQKGVKDWDSAKAATNAAAWTLTAIKLPSGGKLEVTYESDDYAYVQDRRAMQMFEIAGFAASAAASPSNNLYEPFKEGNDYRYVFVNVPEQVNSVGEIKEKYLEGVNRLFFKLFVKMPADRWGSGHEFVPCYADIIDYGIKGSPADKKIWIQLATVKGDGPLAMAALQFLRLNLPSKAYPYSEPGDNITIKDAAGMLASVAANIDNSIKGFGAASRNKNLCNSVLLAKSFVRLNNPYYKKLGGGLRVKRVKLYDNWNAMTGGQQQEANYGTEYSYTTVRNIRGVNTLISSGVATYEPVVGNDENPFRISKDYVEKLGVLAPSDNLYSEEPFGETFFPSPSVGYSKITVQTIHKDKKSANGLQETEYYTAREFPVITEFTALDAESKKTFNPLINNILRFNAKHYVTLSQGFRVELNDMHGQLKSQSNYAQSDLQHPISYTKNYYKLQNDSSSRPRLSNKVATIDSANGVIRQDAELGKDVEIMIDVREQKSSTFSGSFEANIDIVHIPPPIMLGSFIPLPSSETNKYRSVAILKVVNRHALLDSVVHFEKGSKVSTRNTLYDAETGDVLLTQTNNEFDDPVYNFNYPAHWAYSGMGLAYRNIGAVFSNLSFRQGKMFYPDGLREFPVERFFESGDELLVYARDKRVPFSADVCSPFYYFFTDKKRYSVIWALDAAKAKEGDRGIYFIDKEGRPFSAVDASVKIIRSGKRNMPGVSLGAITSLKNPVKTVNGVLRVVFDSTTNVIAAGAAKFKDFWKVDSTGYSKDTTVTGFVRADSITVNLIAKDNYSIASQGYSKLTILEEPSTNLFEASSYDYGPGEYEYQRKSWAKFDFNCIPRGAVIKSARLELPAVESRPHKNERTSNSVYIKRVIGPWVRDEIAGQNASMRYTIMGEYFDERNRGRVDEITKVFLPATPANVDNTAYGNADVTQMVQLMLNDYYNSYRVVKPTIMIRLVDPTGALSGSQQKWSRRTYQNAYASTLCPTGGCGNINVLKCYVPRLYVTYYLPCSNGASPSYNTSPTPGYYCYNVPKDTFVCKPNINDTAVNPYRWGILGNWRMDRSYTYYDRRVESDPLQATNIRTNGVIKSFAPYWQFADTVLRATNDSMRWVWNSEMVHINRKGFEIENRDPLGRFNSGQYGYSQTLPIAVAQNSKAREMFFEGFEDFNYKTDTCKKCQDIRFTDIGVNGNKVDTVSHTGKYSLRIPGNQTLSTQLTLGTLYNDTLSSNISFKIDSIATIRKRVAGAGGGLHTRYKHYGRTSCTSGGWIDLPNSNIGVNWGQDPPSGGCSKDYFYVQWTGYIQPRHTGVYTFHVKYDDAITVIINNRTLTSPKLTPASHDYNAILRTDTITLEAGQTYPIAVESYEERFDAQAWLYWESNDQPFEVVPATQLYRNLSDATGTVQTDTTYCVKVNNVKPLNVTLKRFSPMQGSRVVVSAWVKQETPCVNGRYEQVRMELEFNDGATTTFVLTPKGNIIEGWQRIEEAITIPATATNATVRLKSTSAAAVYFDDLRIHPYNSNMKSFVYNPVNIRLMAELDENNHATFYEYDDDGTLIRVKKETERGIKTIRETRSALYKNQ